MNPADQNEKLKQELAYLDIDICDTHYEIAHLQDDLDFKHAEITRLQGELNDLERRHHDVLTQLQKGAA